MNNCTFPALLAQEHKCSYTQIMRLSHFLVCNAMALFAILVVSTLRPSYGASFSCVRDTNRLNTVGAKCILDLNGQGQFETLQSCDEGCNRLCARGFKPSCNFTSVCKVYGFAINLMSVGAGLVALMVLLYGAYRYVMGKGVAEEISKAQAILINAGIGLVLVVVAYSLTRLVLALLQVDTVCF